MQDRKANKRYKITALAYDRKGRLICIGRNSYTKTHPLQAKFARKAKTPDRIYLHAELDALIKAQGKGLDVHRLEILRYDSKGKPANAKPCASCQIAIAEFKVKDVVHT